MSEMNRRHFLGAVGMMALAAGAVAAGRTKPNIVLIVADDMGRHQAGCYGNHETPNIDRSPPAVKYGRLSRRRSVPHGRAL